MALELQPITLNEANLFIEQYHRHHAKIVGWKYGIAVNDGKKIVGVITIGRPVARHYNDGWTLEVTRCCTDETKNACSKLYAAAWRVAKNLGYKKLITYTLETEPGTSLKAAGFKVLYKTRGGSWSCKSRPRIDKHPTIPKLCWEKC
jgi:hypothetical protein